MASRGTRGCMPGFRGSPGRRARNRPSVHRPRGSGRMDRYGNRSRQGVAGPHVSPSEPRDREAPASPHGPWQPVCKGEAEPSIRPQPWGFWTDGRIWESKQARNSGTSRAAVRAPGPRGPCLAARSLAAGVQRGKRNRPSVHSPGGFGRTDGSGRREGRGVLQVAGRLRRSGWGSRRMDATCGF